MPSMRTRKRIKERLENLEWALMSLKSQNSFFSNFKNLILTTEQSIEELNWVLGKPMQEKVK